MIGAMGAAEWLAIARFGVVCMVNVLGSIWTAVDRAVPGNEEKGRVTSHHKTMGTQTLIFSMGLFNLHIKLGDVKSWARGTGSEAVGSCSF